MWKDNLEDIGTIKGFGKVESLLGEPNIEVMAIQTIEDRDKLQVFIEEIVLMFNLEEADLSIFRLNRKISISCKL